MRLGLSGVRLVAAVLPVLLTGALAACGDDDPSPAQFCNEVGRVPVVTSAEQLNGDGGQATLADLQRALGQLKAQSPKEVRKDLTTLASVTGRLQEALRHQSSGNESSRDEATSDLDASLAAFQQASARVVAYTRRTCGFELGDQH